MSKKFYCAKCGLKLEVIQKANPQQGTVMNLVIPHECQGEFEILDKESEEKVNKKVDELFKEFPFVSKLNKATAEHETVTQESGDKRGKEHLRNELVTSSAPLSVLDMVGRSNTSPAHDLEEPKR